MRYVLQNRRRFAVCEGKNRTTAAQHEMQSDRQRAHTQNDGRVEREEERERERERGRVCGRPKEMIQADTIVIARERYIQTHTHTDRHTDSQTERQHRETQRDRQTDTERQTDTQRDRQTHTAKRRGHTGGQLN